jgi:pimeloyl-ACP methyl ester carboxylesterase
MSTTYRLVRPRDTRETLLCLHSSASSGRQWDTLAAMFAPRFHVHTPDLLGYSPEGWRIGRLTSLDEEAEHVAPLLPAGGAHVFGHSYGAAVALQLALRWPERVRSLTLYEPVRFGVLLQQPAPRQEAETIVGVGRRIGLEVLSRSLREAGRQFVDYWSGAGAWDRLSPRRQEGVAARMSKVHADFEAVFSDRVPLAAYARLAMPIQLMGGTRSPLPARKVLELLAAKMPEAAIRVIPGLAHMAPVSDPETVAEHLPPWLSMHELTARAA